MIERHSLGTGASVGYDWVIPLPSAKCRPFDESVRAVGIPAPEFPAGAVVEVERVKAKNRGKKEVPALKLTFPAANAVKGTRPYDYHLEITDGSGKKTYRSMLAEGVELGVGSSAASGASSFVLALSTLPAGRLEFKVRPGESFGKLGNPISAAFNG